MITFILFLFIIARLLFLFFFKFKNVLVYPEYFILAPPIILFCIPFLFGDFQSLSYLTNFGLLVVFILSFISSKSIYKIFNFQTKKFRISETLFKRVIIVLSNIYLAIILSTVIGALSSNSILEILLSNRLEVYFDEGISKASSIGALSTIFSFFYYIRIALYFKNKRYLYFFFLIFLEIFYLSLVAVTRLSVVFPILSLLIYLGYNSKISVRKILTYSVFIFVFLTFFMSVANRLRTGQEITEIGSYGQTFSNLANELNYEYYHELIIDYAELNDFEYGYGWYLGGVINFVPRFLYKNKPVTSSANRLTEKISGESPSFYNPVMTFTLIGDGYYQLGYLGVIINIFIFYILSSIIFWKLYNLPNDIGIYLLIRFSFLAFIYFRAEIPFIQFIVYLILIYFTNLLYNERIIIQK